MLRCTSQRLFLKILCRLTKVNKSTDKRERNIKFSKEDEVYSFFFFKKVIQSKSSKKLATSVKCK